MTMKWEARLFARALAGAEARLRAVRAQKRQLLKGMADDSGIDGARALDPITGRRRRDRGADARDF
jgi:hypothetical protein